MLAENMNTTTSFVIVVLVATHGIIGNETTLDTIEEQTDDSLGLTTESISRNDDVQISTTYSEDSTYTTEQDTIITDNTSTELRTAKRDSNENTTEDFAITTEEDRVVPNNDSTEHLKTSVTHKTTTEHEAPTINVKEQILKQDSKENATKLNKHTRKSDENIITTTDVNESLRAPLDKLDNTTENLPGRSVEIAGDEKDESTSEHEALLDMKDLFKSDESDIEITTNFRRRLNFEPVLLESRTGRNNMETATVARTNSLIWPDQFSNLQQNNPKPYGNRPQYSTPPTPFNSLEINTLPPLPRYTNQQPNFYQPPRPLHPNSMDHGLLPHDQFDNQHVTAPLSTQTLRPPFLFWPPPLPMETLQPPHQQLSSQMPDRRMSTVQPTRTNLDNIFASLQRASLHPVLSTKQYSDFYQKNWNRNMFK